MSILKLKGSTSGYVELTAPATAGNNTITLPTTAGTVAVRDTSNNVEVGTGVTISGATANTFTVSTNGSERVRVDSSGRFGVGDTAPSTFDVRGAKVTITDSVGDGIGIKGRRDSLDRFYVGLNSSDHLELNQIRNNQLVFKTNNTEVARLTNDGKLLVGTTTARSFLGLDNQIQVESITNHGSLSLTTNRSDVYGSFFSFLKSRGTTAGSVTTVQNGDQLGAILFNGTDGTQVNIAASIYAYVDGTPGTNDMPGRIVFSTTADGASSPTERMRIANNGEQSSYTTTTGTGFNYGVSASAGTSTALFGGSHSATSTTSLGTVSFRVWSNGNVQNTNGSYTAISDAKLKENIVDANSQWNDLKEIKIRNWNFKEETGYETHTQIGPIAQELEEVCPGLVFETPDRDEEGNDLGTVTKGVNQSVLYMKAVKALQEAMERIETLEIQNDDFAARLAALESA